MPSNKDFKDTLLFVADQLDEMHVKLISPEDLRIMAMNLQLIEAEEELGDGG